MRPAAIPPNEAERLAVLQAYGILDTPPEQSFDDLTRLAAQICQTPIALISLVDEHREWFKAKVGIEPREISRKVAFCAHTILESDLLVISDTLEDPRFHDNPLVRSHQGIRFYAGVPLRTQEGAVLGALCVQDIVPRQLTPAQIDGLRMLSGQVTAQLELRGAGEDLSSSLTRAIRSEALIRGLYDASPMIMGVAEILGEDIRCIWGNAASARLLGCRQEEQEGRLFSEMGSPPEVVALWLEYYRRCDASGEPQRFEYPRTTSEGARWLAAVVSKVGMGPAGPPRFAYVIEDVTAQRSTQAALSASNAMLNGIIQMSPLAICTVDLEGRVQTWNETAERVFGWSAEEVVGRLLPVVPDDLQEEFHRFREVTLREDGFTDVETIRQRKDGSRIAVSVSTSALRTQLGDPYAVMFVYIDITARVLAEQELRTTTARLTALLNGANYTIIHSDPEGRILTFNPAAERMLGYRADEVVGRADPGIFHDPAEIARRAEELTAELGEPIAPGIQVLTAKPLRGMADEHEWTLYRKDGSSFPAQVSVSAVRDPHGVLLGYIGLANDITARRRDQEQLRRARDTALESARLKTEFLANMSHEIRTPMNAVIGMTGLLLDTELSGVQRQYTEILRHSAEGLLSLINDILDLSKVEAGRLSVEAIPFSPLEAMEEVADLLGHKAAERDIGIRVISRADVPGMLVGDAARIRQVLTNLVGNGVKFTPIGGVTIRAEWQPAEAETGLLTISVEDTGIGIAPDKLGHIFDKFTQADASTTRRFGGTGLGLAISKQLVELMGGRIGVRSAEGQGSTFWFQLPLKRPAVNLAAPAPGDHLPQSEGQAPVAEPRDALRLRILLVEDNPVNQLVALRLLQKFGCRADVAGNGVEAVEMFKIFPYDVVLMDCQMPELDGFEATRAIRRLEQPGRRTPILAMTANVMEGDREKCLAAGMDQYLPKPIRPKDLRAALEHLATTKERAAAATSPVNPAGQSDTPSLDPTVLSRLGMMPDGEDSAIVIELIDTFLADLPQQLARIEVAADQGDATLEREAARALRSASALVGATELSRSCAEMERRAIDGRQEDMVHLVGSIRSCALSTERQLRELRTERLGLAGRPTFP